MTLQITLTHAIHHLQQRALRQWSSGKRLGGTIMWLGAPGLGKTKVQEFTLREVAKQLGCSILVHTVTLADIEVVDVKGMALPAKNPETGSLDRIVYTRSGILPTPEQEAEFDLIFLQIDEVPASSLDHIKVLRQLILEYRLGSIFLDPAKYVVACTGNDVSHKSGAIRIPAHGVNALCMMHVEPDVKPWLEWSATDEAIVPPLARAFVEMRPTLFTENTIPSEPNHAFPTLRSFTLGMQDLLSTYSTLPYDKDPDPHAETSLNDVFVQHNAPVATTILSSYIGEGVATEFMAFGRVRELLVPLSEILADPDECRMPTDSAAAFAQASYVISWANDKNVSKLVRFVMRMRRDMRAATFFAIRRRVPSIVTVKEFAQFARENAGLVQTTLNSK